MRKLYFSLVALMLLMVSGTAKAQTDYTATFDVQWTNDWVAGEQYFSAAEVAEKLSITTDDLKTLLDAEQKDTNKPFAILSGSDKVTTPYSADPIGWWIADDGTLGWSDDAKWFVCTEYVEADGEELTEDKVGIIVGQMPDVYKNVYTATTLSATVYIVSGDKEVSFAVTQNIEAAEAPSLGDPVMSFAQLNVVKEYAATIYFKEGGQYEGQPFSVATEGLSEALGCTDADISSSIDKILIYQKILETSSGSGVYAVSDEMAVYSWPADGWFGRFAGAEGETLPINGGTSWSAGCTFYLQQLGWSDGKLTFNSCGQYPGTMKAGDADKVELYICNGEKAAKVTISAVIGSPFDVKFNEAFDAHTIINSSSPVSASASIVKGRKGKAEFDVTNLINVLKLFAPDAKIEDVSDVIDEMTAGELAQNAEGLGDGGERSNKLQQLSQTGSLMFDSYGADGIFLTWSPAADTQCTYMKLSNPVLTETEDNKYLYTIDAEAGTDLNVGDEASLTFYLVYDSYALQLTLNATIEQPTTLDQMNKVGEQNLTVEVKGVGYLNKTVEFDVDDVKTKLGVESAADIDSWVLDSAEGLARPQNDNNSIHYWQNTSGQICGWGSSAVAMFYPGDAEYTTLPTGTMIDKGVFTTLKMDGYGESLQPGTSTDPVTLRFIFMHDNDYYLINCVYTVTKDPLSEDFEIKQVAASEYTQLFVTSEASMPYKDKWELDMDYLQEQLGVTSADQLTCYADKADEEGVLAMSDAYNCSPFPGFWYGIKTYEDTENVAVVDASGWTSSGDNAFGYTLADGVITFYIFARPVGEEYKANIYIMNASTGSYVKYLFTARYVESVTPDIPSNVVGEINKDVVFTSADEFEPIDIDLAAVAAEMGMTDVDENALTEIFTPDGWQIATGAKTWETIGVFAGSDYQFVTPEGYAVQNEDEVPTAATLMVDDQGWQIVYYDPNDPTIFDNGGKAAIRMAIDYAETDESTGETTVKRVLYTIWLMSDDTFTGIEGVKASAGKKNSGTFNVAGQRVDAAYKGIVIKDGKKFLQK